MTRIIKRTALKLAAIAGVLKKRKLRRLFLIACSTLVAGFAVTYALQGTAQIPSSSSVCPRPPAGSVVNNPPEIRNPDASNPANFTVLDPLRTIAIIDTQAQLTAAAISSASASAPELNVDLTEVSGDRFSGLNQENPVQQRTLYFSENDTGTVFYITVLGNQPKVFDPNFKTPDITVEEGTTEDWLVQNRAQEAHVFHIHQIHFLVLESPDPSEIGTLRDTIEIPTWNGDLNTPFPSVKLRMDFRGAQKDTSIAGTFVYHCHILEHEDKGMMAAIEVKS